MTPNVIDIRTYRRPPSPAATPLPWPLPSREHGWGFFARDAKPEPTHQDDADSRIVYLNRHRPTPVEPVKSSCGVHYKGRVVFEIPARLGPIAIARRFWRAIGAA